MSKTEWVEVLTHLENAVQGLQFGFSKVENRPDAGAFAGVWMGLLLALGAMQGRELAFRTLREFGEGNVTLLGMRDDIARLSAGFPPGSAP